MGQNGARRMFRVAVFAATTVGLAGCSDAAFSPADPTSQDSYVLHALRCALNPGCFPRFYEGISASRDGHNLRLFTDGSFRSWGPNSNGRLGRNSTNDVGDGVGLSIIQAGDVQLGYPVTHVAAGHQYSCAIRRGGFLRCWGFNNNGQLGDNSTTTTANGVGPNIETISDVPVGGTVEQVAPGAVHTCALLSDGNVRCWGDGANGRLGYGDTAVVGNGGAFSILTRGNVPVGEKVAQIATGNAHTCAVLVTGAVRCWGQGTNGKLGYNSVSDVGSGSGPLPNISDAGNVPLGGTATQISLGTDHSCALLTTGAIRCWGLGTNGRLGYGNPNSVGNGGGTTIEIAGDVPLPAGAKATYVSAGPAHTCALLEGGAVRCWGLGTFGRLGYGNTSSVGDGGGTTIQSAGDVPIGGVATHLTAGSSHTCVILTTGGVRCWGTGAGGTLGHNSMSNIGDGVGLSIIQAGDVPIR